LYVANTAMVSQQLRQTVVSHNLANLSTVGYKADAAVLRAFPAALLWRLGGPERSPIGLAEFGVALGAVETDHRMGPLVFTGRPLDLAIAGEGYFVLQSPDGDLLYTRNGAFAINQEGYLVGEQGYRVLGEGGPLLVGTEEAEVLEDGTVRAGDESVGRLLVVEFVRMGALEKAGSSLFRAAGEADPTPVTPHLKAGFLEQSNVEAARAIVELFEAFRAYEASQRVLKAHDEFLGRAAQEIGALR
jgi:flagellar basal-body rod protein FlgG